jgi:hypothetical protein
MRIRSILAVAAVLGAAVAAGSLPAVRNSGKKEQEPYIFSPDSPSWPESSWPGPDGKGYNGYIDEHEITETNCDISSSVINSVYKPTDIPKTPVGSRSGSFRLREDIKIRPNEEPMLKFVPAGRAYKDERDIPEEEIVPPPLPDPNVLQNWAISCKRH